MRLAIDAKIVVSTTRPETLFGDVAVAVHPDDARYRGFHGAHLRHPFNDSTLPVVCDTSVKMELGTGAVKITPAHDVNDYDVGLRHDLPMLEVMDDNGNMINMPSEYQVNVLWKGINEVRYDVLLFRCITATKTRLVVTCCVWFLGVVAMAGARDGATSAKR